jgi:L-serine dehydratase
MPAISVFDIFKIGVGPSSSHTIGPWRACADFVERHAAVIEASARVTVTLYGSLAKTGVGHGTDTAVIMGLTGAAVDTVDTVEIPTTVASVRRDCSLRLGTGDNIHFDPQTDIVFCGEAQPFHANAMCVELESDAADAASEMYYSIGGGFVLRQTEAGIEPLAGERPAHLEIPYPVDTAAQLQDWCWLLKAGIGDVVWENELIWAGADTVCDRLDRIVDVMIGSVYEGCCTEGILPGGLNVKRRAAELSRGLLGTYEPHGIDDWLTAVSRAERSMETVTDWVTCFAMAVNEVNAAGGRIVTAPTNGAAGVIPAVLLYYRCLSGETVSPGDLRRFLLVAGEIGSLFKKGATISAAAGGCQAEIGVSSAMAAAALTSCRGGSTEQALIAAEVAMEHHLGLTCDPIRGLVQIPCIERNSMGAMKAITASQIALKRDPEDVRVSLDDVVETMRRTAEDMSSKYKETAEGGLAISVNLPDC